MVVERLDTCAVSGEEQLVRGPIIDCECEHSANMLQAIGSPLPIGGQQNFSIGIGLEGVPEPYQLSAQFLITIDLAVEHDHVVAVERKQRLISTFDINDGEPRIRQSYGSAWVQPRASRIRTTVVQRSRHCVYYAGCIRLPGRAVKTTDTAHNFFMPGEFGSDSALQRAGHS